MSRPKTTTVLLLSAWVVVGYGCGSDGKSSPPSNGLPTSYAGSDQTVNEGDTVQLAGQGDDPDGTSVSFTWTQISGPTVALSSVSDPVATFVAPEVPIRNSEPVVLSLRVTDTAGASRDDEVSVAVASTDYLIFVADRDEVRKDELYLFDPETDVVRMISGPLLSSRRVSNYSISPNGRWVAYRADQDTENIDELYVAASDGSGSNKISGSLPPNGDVRPNFVWSPDSLNIAFFADSDQPGVFDLFVVDPLGNELRRIAPINDQAPAIAELDGVLWSPDGRYLAQVERSSEENFVRGVNVYDSRAATPNNLRISPIRPTGIAEGGSHYDWAPDSSRITYTASLDTAGVTELYTVRIDGTDNRKVSVPIVVGEAIGSPIWSPDSNRIVYPKYANMAQDVELYTVRPDGTDSTKINTSPVRRDYSGIPFWSPDSSRIAYTTEPNASGEFDIVTVRPDGTDSVSISGSLLRSSVTTFPPSVAAWSPDSSRIAYVGIQGAPETFELFTVRPDGTERANVSGPLVAGGDLLAEPVWSPDNSRIAYMADQNTDGVVEVFTVRPDGSDNARINGPLVLDGNAGGPLWSSDGSRIAYGADQDVDGVTEAYLSTPDGLSNWKVSEPLVQGGTAGNLTWSP